MFLYSRALSDYWKSKNNFEEKRFRTIDQITCFGSVGQQRGRTPTVTRKANTKAKFEMEHNSTDRERILSWSWGEMLQMDQTFPNLYRFEKYHSLDVPCVFKYQHHMNTCTVCVVSIVQLSMTRIMTNEHNVDVLRQKLWYCASKWQRLFQTRR